MNRLLATIILLTIFVSTNAQTPFKGADYIYYYQVGIGKTNGSLTNPSAWLEIGKDSTNKAMRMPRVVDTANISSPVYGLQVYQIKDNGVYFRDKVSWKRMLDPGVLNFYLLKADSTIYYPYWSNPRGYLTSESDPVANAKTVRWVAGTGINVSNGAAQALSTNPVATISAQNTTAIWNANQIQGRPVSTTAPTSGQYLQYNGSQYVPVNAPVAGTVTSVGLSLPSLFNVSGSPVTTSGVLTGTLAAQGANLVFASPNGISGVPLFRGLTNSDLPASGISANTYGSDTTIPVVTINTKGIATAATNTLVSAPWENIKRKPNNGDYIYNNGTVTPQVASIHISQNAYIIGRVGIGSNTPSYKLGVRDTSTVLYTPTSITSDRPVGVVGVNLFNASDIDGGGGFYVLSTRNSSSQSQQTFIGSISSAGGNNPKTVIGQSTGAASYQERLRIDSTGFVGINTTTPAERLHVNGNIVANAPAYSAGGITPVGRNNTTGRLETFSAGGGGSVTSVALAAPPEFSVSGSPVTTSGTLTLTKATQSANTVYAGPTSGGAAQPTFRALVPADIPFVSPGVPTFTPNAETNDILGTGYSLSILGTGDAMKVILTTGTGITTTGTIGQIFFATPFPSAPYSVYSASNLDAIGTQVGFSAITANYILVSNKVALNPSTLYVWAVITHK